MASTPPTALPAARWKPATLSTIGLFVFVVLAWSFNWVAMKLAVHDVTPLWAVALIALLLFAGVTAFMGWGGYKRLELRGPTRSIQSIKETVAWAKARVLGRNAS